MQKASRQRWPFSWASDASENNFLKKFNAARKFVALY
jgi:hypothetical protein